MGASKGVVDEEIGYAGEVLNEFRFAHRCHILDAGLFFVHADVVEHQELADLSSSMAFMALGP